MAMADYTQIKYETLGRVARVILNRPRYLNAQSRVLREEMDAAFAVAVEDPEIRVIILAGEGEHFSSGHDLGTPEELEDARGRPYVEGLGGRYKRSWDQNVENSLRWRELPKPTIAQVHGYCIFGGWLIASAMDLIVAADDAMFLPSHFQYFSVPWDLGARKTKELLWLGRFVKADEALDLGFVNRVVPRAELEAETLALANEVARMEPFAARMVKFSVNQAQDAQGFRTSVRAAHSNYMLIEQAGLVRPPGDEAAGKRRLPGVDRALKKLQG
jgi:enoyl-CoA hydratase